MARAVTYSRFSTDLQNDQSVEDQISLCRDYAARQGWDVTADHYDRAKSGASMFGRPGLATMMQAAESGEFDILVSESPDRISRDIADLATVHKMLTFRGIEIHAVNGGKLDTVQIGMYGIVGQMQREEGAKKVKRGMVGVVRSGRNAGGKAYGYRPIPGRKGELEIVQEEAETIRRIFHLYASGVAPRTIAATLNVQGIPAPRGKNWNASTINGNGQRGNGILRNTIYTGRIVWNRVRMIKDPSTGRRVSRINPEEALEQIDAPHLRIVDDELFNTVQARKEATGGEWAKKGPRSRRLLSGLLRCGNCGGGMALIGPDRSGNRIQCSTFRESSSCTNGRRYYIERIEAQVLDTLRTLFADTSVIDEYVREYEQERRRLESEARRNRASTEKALIDTKAAISRIVEQVAFARISDEEADRLLPQLRADKARLDRELAAMEAPTNVIELHPRAVKRLLSDRGYRNSGIGRE